MCKGTKNTRAPCKKNPESREDKIPQVKTFGDPITADHKLLNGIFVAYALNAGASGRGTLRFQSKLQHPEPDITIDITTSNTQ